MINIIAVYIRNMKNWPSKKRKYILVEDWQSINTHNMDEVVKKTMEFSYCNWVRFPPTHNTDNPEVLFEETSPDYSLVE